MQLSWNRTIPVDIGASGVSGTVMRRGASYVITEAITTVAEYVAGLGFDAAKERVQGKLDEKKLQAELTVNH